MTPTQSTTMSIPETLSKLYTEMAISPLVILKEYALTHIHTTIQKLDLENRSFEQKYGCTFHEFQARLEAMENEENFSWEDDLMDWEFAKENLTLWTKRKEELEAE